MGRFELLTYERDKSGAYFGLLGINEKYLFYFFTYGNRVTIEAFWWLQYKGSRKGVRL